MVAAVVTDRTENDTQCTDCGGDATVGMTKLAGPEGVIVADGERLCMKCLNRRTGFAFFDRRRLDHGPDKS